MGSGKKLFALRKDGTEFSVDIMIDTVETEKGPVAIAILRNLTERNEFERKQTLLTQTLQGIVTEIKVLRGLPPIGAR